LLLLLLDLLDPLLGPLVVFLLLSLFFGLELLHLLLGRPGLDRLIRLYRRHRRLIQGAAPFSGRAAVKAPGLLFDILRLLRCRPLLHFLGTNLPLGFVFLSPGTALHENQATNYRQRSHQDFQPHKFLSPFSKKSY